MNYRKMNKEIENEKNLIPVSFIEQHMQQILEAALHEKNPEKRYDLELCYEVLRKIVFKWRMINE